MLTSPTGPQLHEDRDCLTSELNLGPSTDYEVKRRQKTLAKAEPPTGHRKLGVLPLLWSLLQTLIPCLSFPAGKVWGMGEREQEEPKLLKEAAASIH